MRSQPCTDAMAEYARNYGGTDGRVKFTGKHYYDMGNKLKVGRGSGGSWPCQHPEDRRGRSVPYLLRRFPARRSV